MEGKQIDSWMWHGWRGGEIDSGHIYIFAHCRFLRRGVSISGADAQAAIQYPSGMYLTAYRDNLKTWLLLYQVIEFWPCFRGWKQVILLTYEQLHLKSLMFLKDHVLIFSQNWSFFLGDCLVFFKINTYFLGVGYFFLLCDLMYWEKGFRWSLHSSMYVFSFVLLAFTHLKC